MRPIWIRIGADEVSSVRVGRLADALELAPVHALGHVTAFCGAVARHRPDGNLADVPDSVLELWGAWNGERGRFAAAVREVLLVDQGVESWSRTFGKEVEERAKDSERKRGNRPVASSLPATGNSTEDPRNVAGIMADNVAESAEAPCQEENRVTDRQLLAAGCTREAALLSSSAGRSALPPNTPAPAEARPCAPTTGPRELRADGLATNAVPHGELQRWAVTLTTAANQGVTAALGEQPTPIRADAQLAGAEQIRATGIDLELARAVVRSVAEEAARRGHCERPRSLGYFVDACWDAMAHAIERQRVADTPQPHGGPLASRTLPTRRKTPRSGPGAAGQQAYNTAIAVANALGGGRPR